MTDLEAARAAERVGAEHLDAYCACATPDVVAMAGLQWRRVGGAVQMRCDKVPVLNRNRTQGLGVSEPLDDALLDDALAFHRPGPAEFALMVAPFAEPATHDAALRSRGLTWWRRRAVHVRDTSPAPVPAGAPVVRPVAPHEFERFAALLESLHGTSPVAVAWTLAGLRQGLHRGFVACVGDEPVAAAAMALCPSGAWLGAAATHPDHRRRGAQAALLAARIEAAGEAGARLLVVETIEPAPGEDATSHRNVGRAGFRLAYLRPSWVPAPPREGG